MCIRQRTVRGARVPDEFDVTIVGDKERQAFAFFQIDVFRETAQASLGGARRIVHGDVFMYSIAFASDDPRMAVLTLCFYRKVIFLAVIDHLYSRRLGENLARLFGR